VVGVADEEKAEDVVRGVGPHGLVAGVGAVALAFAGLEHDVADIRAVHLDEGMRQTMQAVRGESGLEDAVTDEHLALGDQVFGVVPLAGGQEEVPHGHVKGGQQEGDTHQGEQDGRFGGEDDNLERDGGQYQRRAEYAQRPGPKDKRLPLGLATPQDDLARREAGIEVIVDWGLRIANCGLLRVRIG
jgi:hypothetical protein